MTKVTSWAGERGAARKRAGTTPRASSAATARSSGISTSRTIAALHMRPMIQVTTGRPESLRSVRIGIINALSGCLVKLECYDAGAGSLSQASHAIVEEGHMDWFVCLGLGVVIVVVALAVIALYNRLVVLRNRVDNAWAQIDVQLKRRYDLIPNLVETVKGYAAHESETLEAVIQARNMAMSAQRRASSRARPRTCSPAR